MSCLLKVSVCVLCMVCRQLPDLHCKPLHKLNPWRLPERNVEITVRQYPRVSGHYTYKNLSALSSFALQDSTSIQWIAEFRIWSRAFLRLNPPPTSAGNLSGYAAPVGSPRRESEFLAGLIVIALALGILPKKNCVFVLICTRKPSSQFQYALVHIIPWSRKILTVFEIGPVTIMNASWAPRKLCKNSCSITTKEEGTVNHGELNAILRADSHQADFSPDSLQRNVML